ncbi:MAG: HlyC/CorC family transporter [Polyangiaceae bacterium]|nr:HlyC/CorC family transporter [Polyangiaceae bacterium]
MLLLPVVVVTLNLVLNALYVAAEFSMVAASRPQIARLAASGNERAARLLRVLESPTEVDRYIAACQIGITLTSLIAGAVGQATVSPQIQTLLQRHTGLTDGAAASWAAVSVLALLTVLQVVIGELVPKSYALERPVQTALATHRPMALSVLVLRHVVTVLNGSGLLILRAFGMKTSSHHHVHSPAEIDILLAESREQGALSDEAHRQLQHGLRLSELTVHDLMVPRSRLATLEVSTPGDEVLKRLLSSPYSQLVVYRGSLDDVLGTVSTKDVAGLVARCAPGAQVKLPPLTRLVRTVPFIPETLRADRVVGFLQERGRSKAIVVDEHGSVEGFITMEDLLKEVFGEVQDELKEPSPEPQLLPDGRTLLPGGMALREATPWIGQEPESDASTLGGFVTERLGRIPVVGDTVSVAELTLTVHAASEAQVTWVAVPSREETSAEPAPPEAAEGEPG